MRLTAFIGICMLSVLFGSGCADMNEWNLESQKAISSILHDCVAQRMTKSELIMQVGPPTAKEAVEDGEIWFYELVDRGDTTTTGYVGPYGSFSANSSTPVAKSTVMVRFNQSGVMVDASTSDPVRAQFRFLRPPRR
jgi:hypothetical protein